MAEAVWITGAGSLTNLGSGFNSILEVVQKPKTAFRHVPQEWLGYMGAPDAFIARLNDAAEEELKKFETVATDRATAMALTVAAQAWQHAGLHSAIDPARSGVYWGTGMGGLDTTESTYQRLLIDKALLRPMTVVRIMANAAAASIALKYKLQGPNQTYSVACASSAIALGEAMWAIRTGRMDMAVVGGAEAMLAPGVMAAWGALKVLALRKNTVDAALPCRPFSRERSGLVIGEGAAALVLESESHARARGAKPLAELAGYASSCDASSLVHPAIDGQVRAMRGAITDAGLTPEAVDGLNAHATGTDTGDVVEAEAFEQVFGPSMPPVSSTKAMHGHLLGAAGAVEAVICLASLQTQITPATLGLANLDERCAALNVTEQPRSTSLQTILSNSFAFGGSNASLLFRRVD